ncbi:DNA-binding Lrp family transcriptional regulator [Natronocella acetinitrilica]|jgi:Lrp/AsnC family transcriptional regulator, leucine-responsive regulatory protein|uniref:DNA-binding Lrp family transcriptional regulator n=1 Tax=Natronocella acetinitrilica TaxID=414046 RepID=A0AAE3KBV9_9GAMM|nr:Lrp/AsnC family transcriptional regulator [Natronocella acetinitrilica]MCP1675051.1 DNA-binding Lrp family transcriptional regulator [Natronocella acetinitrilica]
MSMRTAILRLLIRNARMSYADMARELDCSRAYAREQVQKLVDDGVIEQFTVVLNPDKLGKTISAFLDVKVTPWRLEQTARELSDTPEVVSLYIMSDMKSLHIHTLTDSPEELDRFLRENLLGKEYITDLDCKMLMSRVKHRRGGPRL